MKYPLADLLDRLSIIALKTERIKDPENFKEYISLKEALTSYNFKLTNSYLLKLKNINSKIWDLEADIRQEKEAELGLEEVGRRAIKIRQLNKKRIAIKNEITKKSNSGFIDIKKNHGSE